MCHIGKLNRALTAKFQTENRDLRHHFCQRKSTKIARNRNQRGKTSSISATILVGCHVILTLFFEESLVFVLRLVKGSYGVALLE